MLQRLVSVSPSRRLMWAQVQPLDEACCLVVLPLYCRWVVQLLKKVVCGKLEGHKVIDFFNLQRIGAKQNQTSFLAEADHREIECEPTSCVLDVNSCFVYDLSLGKIHGGFVDLLVYRLIQKHQQLQVQQALVDLFKLVCPAWWACEQLLLVEQGHVLQTVNLFVFLGSDHLYLAELLQQGCEEV